MVEKYESGCVERGWRTNPQRHDSNFYLKVEGIVTRIW